MNLKLAISLKFASYVALHFMISVRKLAARMTKNTVSPVHFKVAGRFRPRRCRWIEGFHQTLGSPALESCRSRVELFLCSQNSGSKFRGSVTVVSQHGEVGFARHVPAHGGPQSGSKVLGKLLVIRQHQQKPSGVLGQQPGLTLRTNSEVLQFKNMNECLL